MTVTRTAATDVTEGRLRPAPRAQFALVGPRVEHDHARTPVRGDLAHIRLAGRCFVPHYAVPIVYRLNGAGTLRSSPKSDARPVGDVARGRLFDALDIAGDWAWGQVAQEGDDGLVGYLPLNVMVLA